MAEVYSYDIYVLGLKDPTASGRHRFAGTMERLTGRSSDEFEEGFPPSNIPMFQAMDAERAVETADALGDTGALIEVRPTDNPPQKQPKIAAATRECPACNQIQPATNDECLKCGVVFKKYEREQLVKMQKDHTLEQAMIKAMQVREEWLHRATQYLEQHKMAKDASAAFAAELVQDEVPFLRLNSEEGPLLLTSRRLLARRESTFESVPYEMIREVDYGGGKIKTSKSKFRLQIFFHTPFPLKSGELSKNMTWHLDKDSSFSKDVVIDWGYARNFICGACGERDLQYRTDELSEGGHKMHCRCMHCATDHEIDLEECMAVPLIGE
jgi:hypothetical protein